MTDEPPPDTPRGVAVGRLAPLLRDRLSASDEQSDDEQLQVARLAPLLRDRLSVSDEQSDDEQLQVLLAWLKQGYTVRQFLAARDEELAAHQFWAEFRYPNGNIWECPPGFEDRWEKGRQNRQELRELLDKGYFPEWAADKLGIRKQSDIDKIAEQDKLLKERAQIIEVGTAENNYLKRQLRDITLMDQETHNHVMAQARDELIRRGWQPPRR